MSNIKFTFEFPWVFVLLIPAIILSLIPYLKLNKNRRRTRNRITSMVLHFIVLFLITLVFADFRINKEDSIKNEKTILLVDVSSSSSNSKEKIDEYIEDILLNDEFNTKVGIVVFANECEYVSEISTNNDKVLRDYLNYDIKVRQDATNIEDALYFTQNILGEDGGRIIVLTDGIETDGDALLASSKLSQENIRIDAVYFDNEPLVHEVQVDNLEVNDQVVLDKETTINAYISSSYNALVTIKLYDNDKLIGEKETFIRDNELIVPFKHTFKDDGEHELYVTITTEKDTYSENNFFYSFVNITLNTKILIIDGTGTESNKLHNLINKDYEVTVVDSQFINNDLSYLLKYNEVIMMNCSMGILPKGFDKTINEYVKAGGNLFTTGGENTYYYGNMKDTLIEEVLPINIEKDNETPVGIMFVVDASGSMDYTMTGSTKIKMDVAKDALVEGVKAMRDSDYAGIISFNSKATVEIPMTPITKEKDIINAINSINTETGTYYVPGLKTANNELISFDNTDIKHVIFVSDGAPSDTGYKNYITSMYGKGITTSTIAIGSDLDAGELQSMANLGGGNFYSVINATQLKDIMIEEIKSLQSDYLNIKDTPVRIKSSVSVMQGITSLPNISGYIGCSYKDKATLVLQAENDPLYVQWTYEENRTKCGKVGSFMSDLSGNWSSKFFSDERGVKFIKNVIDYLITSTTTRLDMTVQFKRDNFTNIIEIATPSIGSYGKIKAKITYPDETIKEVELMQTSANVYTAEIPNYGMEGLYKIDITKSIGTKVTKVSSFTVFSYSQEYDAFYDSKENFKFIEQMVEKSKGSIYTSEDMIFSNEVNYNDEIINPQITILIIALTLFLLDIVVRKFNFKWPHELFKRKEKEA